QGFGGTAAAADDLAQVVRVHPDLQDAPAADAACADPDIVGMFDDALHEVLEGLLEHVSPRPRTGSRRGPRPRPSSWTSSAAWWRPCRCRHRPGPPWPRPRRWRAGRALARPP